MGLFSKSKNRIEREQREEWENKIAEENGLQKGQVFFSRYKQLKGEILCHWGSGIIGGIGKYEILKDDEGEYGIETIILNDVIKSWSNPNRKLLYLQVV